MNLTAVQIRNAPDGKLSDGRGLFLIKKNNGGSWIWRFTYLGRRRDMGLGKFPDLSLKEARSLRDEWAAVLAKGQNPIEVRKSQTEDALAAEAAKDPTFADMVSQVFEMKKAALRGGGTRGRWRSPLDTHVIPVIGRKRMSQIRNTDIRDAIEPIWTTKHKTAEKAVQRTRAVFREAQLMGHDCNPLTVDSGVRMLGEHIHVVKHTPFTPWQDIPALWGRFDNLSSDMCLKWMILTAVRAHAAREAHVAEVEGDVWVVPAERIKGREGQVQDFRVPLSEPAMAMVEEARIDGRGFMFPGRRNKPLTVAALERRLNVLREEGRPHGFRSSFRSWVQDTDACPWEVSETILGHKVGGKVERSYARSDMLERRRPVMDAWARYVTGQDANVVRIGA